MDKELKEYLHTPDYELLSKFKWGSDGSSEFAKFMNLVRKELSPARHQMSRDEAEKIMDEIIDTYS